MKRLIHLMDVCVCVPRLALIPYSCHATEIQSSLIKVEENENISMYDLLNKLYYFMEHKMRKS